MTARNDVEVSLDLDGLVLNGVKEAVDFIKDQLGGFLDEVV